MLTQLNFAYFSSPSDDAGLLLRIITENDEGSGHGVLFTPLTFAISRIGTSGPVVSSYAPMGRYKQEDLQTVFTTAELAKGDLYCFSVIPFTPYPKVTLVPSN